MKLLKRRIENPALVVLISGFMIGLGFIILGIGSYVYYASQNIFYDIVFKAYGAYLIVRYALKIREDLPLMIMYLDGERK